MPSAKGPTPRERARAEMTEQIKQVARDHLAVDGPNLSLRAVARDLGVVSSAVYRYFASRDDLLTALILDGYASMGGAVEAADAALTRRDPLTRWLTFARTVRDWSVQRPHEFALLYGSPVPGYAAPRDTVEQAQRPLTVAADILTDAVRRGLVPAPADRLPKAVRADVENIATYPGFDGVPPTLLARALTMWAMLFGTISFELFGRYNNAVGDLDSWFEHQARVSARYLGLS